MRTLDLKEAATFLHVHPEELRRHVTAELVRGAKVGGCWVFIEDDLVTYLRSLYVSPGKRCKVTRRVYVTYPTRQYLVDRLCELKLAGDSPTGANLAQRLKTKRAEFLQRHVLNGAPYWIRTSDLWLRRRASKIQLSLNQQPVTLANLKNSPKKAKRHGIKSQSGTNLATLIRSGGGSDATN